MNKVAHNASTQQERMKVVKEWEHLQHLWSFLLELCDYSTLWSCSLTIRSLRYLKRSDSSSVNTVGVGNVHLKMSFQVS